MKIGLSQAEKKKFNKKNDCHYVRQIKIGLIMQELFLNWHHSRSMHLCGNNLTDEQKIRKLREATRIAFSSLTGIALRTLHHGSYDATSYCLSTLSS
jgi:hypothetical protein